MTFKPSHKQSNLKLNIDKNNKQILRRENNRYTLIKYFSGFNIMFDKKVVRGNTYAASVISKNQDKTKKVSKIFKSSNLKSANQIVQQPTQYANETTPKPLINRYNVEIQTDEYVETLTDKPPEQEIEAQTDFYIDKPQERLFIPKKYGIDKDTQIWDGEIFDFDTEVAPVLQVLMNKTLEEARMEVLEEEEIKFMKEQQKQFEKVRNAELAEMQRLDSVQRRLDDDESRRRLQYETARQQATFSHQKLICRLIAKKQLQNLKSNTFRKMEDIGIFRNPLNTSLLGDFVPWLFDQIVTELNQEQDVKDDFKDFLKNVTLTSMKTHEISLDQEYGRKKDILKERQRISFEKIERKQFRKIRINIHDELLQYFLDRVVITPNPELQ